MSFIKIFTYKTNTGKRPYTTWESELDTKTRAVVKTRLDRIRLGNFGDTKKISGAKGIHELRIDYGPGYRIYFGQEGTTVVILLTAGNKKSQTRDIKKAQEYWLNYKETL